MRLGKIRTSPGEFPGPENLTIRIPDVEAHTFTTRVCHSATYVDDENIVLPGVEVVAKDQGHIIKTCHDQVVITVTIEITGRGGSTDHGKSQIAQTIGADRAKPTHFIDTAEDLCTLTILLALLHSENLRFDVAVDLNQIRQTIEIEVEKKSPESERVASGETDAAHRGFIAKRDATSLAIQRGGFVGEVSHREQEFRGGWVANGVDSHGPRRIPVEVEGDTEPRRVLAEGSVSIIEKQAVRGRVVGDENVGVTVTIDIDEKKTERLHH